MRTLLTAVMLVIFTGMMFAQDPAAIKPAEPAKPAVVTSPAKIELTAIYRELDDVPGFRSKCGVMNGNEKIGILPIIVSFDDVTPATGNGFWWVKIDPQSNTSVAMGDEFLSVFPGQAGFSWEAGVTITFHELVDEAKGQYGKEFLRMRLKNPPTITQTAEALLKKAETGASTAQAELDAALADQVQKTDLATKASDALLANAGALKSAEKAVVDANTAKANADADVVKMKAQEDEAKKEVERLKALVAPAAATPEQIRAAEDAAATATQVRTKAEAAAASAVTATEQADARLKAAQAVDLAPLTSASGTATEAKKAADIRVEKAARDLADAKARLAAAQSYAARFADKK